MVSLRDSAERARPRPVDDDGGPDGQESPEVRVDLDLLVEQPADSLVDDPHARDQEQDGFHEGGDVLDLAVAVRVLAICGPSRGLDGVESHRRRHQIQAGVSRLGQHAKASGREADHDLEAGESDRGNQR